MTRVNVTRTSQDPDGADPGAVVGWFDINKATRYDEDTDWNGNGHISLATGTEWDHEILYRTTQGRWVLNRWSQRQGTRETYEFIMDDEAREWLIAQHDDGAVEEHFGEIEEERGPGRPEVGGQVLVRLGALRGRVDQWAAAHQVSRSEAVRRLVDMSLGQAHLNLVGRSGPFREDNGGDERPGDDAAPKE